MFFLGIADYRSSITLFFIKCLNRRCSLFVCYMRTWMHLKGFRIIGHECLEDRAGSN